MKAARYTAHGGAGVIRYEEVPDPSANAADVILSVKACAVNRLDVIQRAGHFTLPGYSLPHIAGMDVVGEVVALGADVDQVSIGTRVVVNPSLAGVRGDSQFKGMGDRHGELGIIGATVDGGYAEYCAVPASHVHAIPSGFSSEEVACLPTCHVTAWHALFSVGHLEAGEFVLIHAAASGLSSAAIQLAKKAGAIVLATAGTDEKLEFAKMLGADHVFNNRTSDIAVWAREVTDGRGVDFVFDHVGPALWEASLHALRPHGRLVNCGGTSGHEVAIELGLLHQMGLKIIGSDAFTYDEFDQALASYWQGGFHHIIDSEFPIAEAAAAHVKMERADLKGKILLKP